MQLLAARHRDLELRPSLLIEIELERNDGHALAVHRAGELVDLALVQQELARAFRRMIETAALQVFRDVGVDEPEFARAAVGVGLRDRRLALAQRLDLGAGQSNASLESLADLIVEASPAIVGDDLELAIRFRRHISLDSPHLLCALIASRISVRSSTSFDGFAGAASSFFCSRVIARMTRNKTHAMIRKLRIMVRKLP